MALLYEIFADGSNTPHAPSTAPYQMATDARPQMCASQTQILILAGGLGYVFTLATNTLTQIMSDQFPQGADKVCFIDGYFIVLESNSQTFAISGLNDGTSWNALDFGDSEGAPGNVVSMVADHRQLWLWSNTSSNIYYDSGNANFPFSRLNGSETQQGCAAIDSACSFDNTVVWLGENCDGVGVVWRANGYTPQRISTHAVEAAIQSYGTISDATAYVYQDGGHAFYVLTFPSARGGLGATWVYDAATGYWHERGFWNGTLGAYEADLARLHAFCWGQHFVVNWQDGRLYTMSQSVMQDAGAPIRRERTCPDLSSDGGAWTFYSEMRLIVQTGVGLDGGVAGSNPQITLQVSDDGGKTWSSERSVSLGPLGAYRTTIRWRRLGRSQNRCFRVVCSEPVFVALIEAALDSTNGRRAA